MTIANVLQQPKKLEMLTILGKFLSPEDRTVIESTSSSIFPPVVVPKLRLIQSCKTKKSFLLCSMSISLGSKDPSHVSGAATTCFLQFKGKPDLMPFLKEFWGLTKNEQDHLAMGSV